VEASAVFTPTFVYMAHYSWTGTTIGCQPQKHCSCAVLHCNCPARAVPGHATQHSTLQYVTSRHDAAHRAPPKCLPAGSGGQCMTQSQTQTRPTTHSVSHTPHASKSGAGPSSEWTSPPRADPGTGSAQHSTAWHSTAWHSTAWHSAGHVGSLITSTDKAASSYQVQGSIDHRCLQALRHDPKSLQQSLILKLRITEIWLQQHPSSARPPPPPAPPPSSPTTPHTLQAVLLSIRSASSLQADRHTFCVNTVSTHSS
jgi:hypothetical protein